MTGDPEIDKFGKTFNELGDEILRLKNARGASITKNKDWHNPTKHDARAIEKAGVESWKEYIKPLLDRSKILDINDQVLNDEQLDYALNEVFKSITTGGLNKTKDFTAPTIGRKLSKKGGEQRFLYFKDAESFVKYNEEFGTGDFFGNLMSYIHESAHDLALLEILGTNPERTFKTLFNMADKYEPLTQRQKAYANWLLEDVTGKTSSGDLRGLAEGMTTLRNIQSATTLGAAMLSSFTDVALQAITAKVNGIPTMQLMGTFIKQLNPNNMEDRMLAASIGAGLDAFTGIVASANRYGDVYGTGLSAKVAEGVMRGSWLSKWTDAGKAAYTMEHSALLARNFNKNIDELPEEIKSRFVMYGIDEKLWDSFRKTEVIKARNGAEYANLIEPGFEKFHQMVTSERIFAVPEPDANTRAITKLGTADGTIEGQAVRTVMNLKSFPITMAQTHLTRMMNLEGADRYKYAGSLLLTLTMFGAVSLQLKDISSGREPRPIGWSDKDPQQATKFLGAAIAQGGGLSVLGDFLFSDVNRFGQGIGSTLIGVTGETFDKTSKLTLGNIQQLLAGDETDFAPELIQYIKRYTPDTWQIRLLTDAMYDQATILVDPEYKAKLEKQMKKRETEYGQGFWWKKGEMLPGN
jgi:hypothetical protein